MKTRHSNPDFSLRFMILAHFLWLSLVCILGAWWGKLIVRQARRISELESALGWAADQNRSQWFRTQRMIYWESATFFALLLACAGLLFWLYWRDVKRAKGLHAFFASVTHELRTPLTSIRLQAESIAENLVGENSQKDLVRRLLEDSMRLEGQVERTLELARVEGGGPVYIRPMQFKPWIDRFLKTWSSDYIDRVEVRTQVEDLVIMADHTALQVIFKNLLENSVRHSKRDKVQVTITTETTEAGVLVHLKDDGQGFQGEPKFLGVLFEKGSSSSGTGVGLYLVKTLMKRMGGLAQFGSPMSSPSQSGFEIVLQFQEGKSHG